MMTTEHQDEPQFAAPLNRCHFGDCIETMRRMPDGFVQTCVTSPPYFGLRDYGHEGQIGLESTPDAYVAKLVAVFREVRRVMRDDGTLWLNLGSSYASGDTNPIRSPLSSRAPACDSDGTAPSNFQAPDSAYLYLCDGCRVALQSSHTQNIDPPPAQCALPHEPTGRDTDSQDYAEASLDASPLDVPASTKSRSSMPLPASCSHCGNCGACLSVLRSASRDARLCARMASCIGGSAAPSLERRSLGMDVSGMACLNYKPKDLIPIPWLVAMALQADGWWLRQDIVWAKPSPMPESVTDRCTKSHEYIFLLSKSATYFYDSEAIKEPSVDIEASTKRYESAFWENGKHQQGGYSANGAKHTAGMKEFYGMRNKRSVWTVASEPYSGAHFATFPRKLIEPCILAGAPVGGVVLDPFLGSGTTAQVAQALGRQWIGCELNRAYEQMQRERVAQTSFFLEAA